MRRAPQRTVAEVLRDVVRLHAAQHDAAPDWEDQDSGRKRLPMKAATPAASDAFAATVPGPPPPRELVEDGRRA